MGGLIPVLCTHCAWLRAQGRGHEQAGPLAVPQG